MKPISIFSFVLAQAFGHTFSHAAERSSLRGRQLQIGSPIELINVLGFQFRFGGNDRWTFQIRGDCEIFPCVSITPEDDASRALRTYRKDDEPGFVYGLELIPSNGANAAEITGTVWDRSYCYKDSDDNWLPCYWFYNANEEVALVANATFVGARGHSGGPDPAALFKNQALETIAN